MYFFPRLSRRAVVLGVIATLAFALLGAAVAPTLLRSGISAETRLVVGDQTLGAQMVPGYTLATVTLAETYARFINRDTVARPELSTVADLHASVIPNNPIIRIQATADNAADAVAGVTAAARILTESVSSVSARSTEASRQDFVATRTAYAAAQAKAEALGAEISAAAKPSDKAKADHQAAVTNAALAQLESDAVGRLLQTQIEAGADKSTGLTTIMSAQVSSSDPKPRLFGALVGAALVVLIWAAASIVGQTRRGSQARVSRSD
jgi:hypothetical protein